MAFLIESMRETMRFGRKPEITPCKQNLLGNRVVVYLIALQSPSSLRRLSKSKQHRVEGQSEKLLRRSTV